MRARRLMIRGLRPGLALSLTLVLVAAPAGVAATTHLEGVDIDLPSGMRISGTITGSGGAPVAGGFVEACELGSCSYGAMTAADGTYTIRGIEPGTYELHASPPEAPSDLTDAWYATTGRVDRQEDASPVDVSVDDAAGVDLELPSGHRISGSVTVVGVGTRAGIVVRANGPSSEEATTASNGSFTIRGLRDGDYTLDVYVPETLDGLSGPVVGGAVGTLDADGSIVTVAGAHVTGQAITTPRGRRLSGRLTGSDAAGGYAAAESESSFRSATIEADGDWTIRGLRPDAYLLTFGAPEDDTGFESLFPLGYWDGGGALALDGDAATLIAVGASDVTGRNATVPPGPTVHGTVRTTDGAALADAYVRMCGTNVGCVGGLTGHDGSWAFRRVRAATYDLQVWHSRHPGGWYGIGGYAEDATHAATITVGTTSVGPIRIVLPGGGSISGTITGDGTALGGVDVSGNDGFGLPPVPPGHDVTASDGTYRLDGLRPGSWSISVHPPSGTDALPGYVSVTAIDGWTPDHEDATEFVIEGPDDLAYVPIPPRRVLDSRSKVGVSGAFANGTPRSFAVTGIGTIPVDAVAVTGNVTVVGQTSAGYVAVGPTMTSQPTSSTINVPMGDVRANNVTLPVSEAGRLAAVFKGATGAATHLVLDITGYFVADEAATYWPVAPIRVLDTRPGGVGGLTAFRAGSPRTLRVAGVQGIPAGAAAITGNLTVTGGTRAGYVSVTRTATTNPATSTINFPAGDTRANGVTAPLDPDGRLAIVYKAAAGASVHVVLDVTGYYLEGPGGLAFHPIAPTRVMDTRAPTYATGLAGRFRHGTARTLEVGGHAFLPATVQAVTGNLTMVGQTAGGYVSMTKSPMSTPTTSTVNAPVGDIRANGVTGPVALGEDVSFTYRGSSGATTHLVLDVTGYFD